MEQGRFRKASVNANRVAFFLSGRLLSLLESLRRGQKGPICEDCQKTGFLSKNLTWGNAGRCVSERLPLESRTRISAFFVPRTSFYEKKGEKRGLCNSRAGWQFRRWLLISHEPGRAFFLWRATIPLMALDASQIENRMPCFSRRKSVGKGANLGWRFPYTGYCAR